MLHFVLTLLQTSWMSLAHHSILSKAQALPSLTLCAVRHMMFQGWKAVPNLTHIFAHQLMSHRSKLNRMLLPNLACVNIQI
jgi:hypothetical protein